MVDLIVEKNQHEVIINNNGHGDVFHAHIYGLYYFFKGLRYGGRKIHTVHTIPETLNGSVPYFKFIEPFAKMYFKWVFDFADICVAISPEVEASLIKLGIKKSKIVSINNPILLDKWAFSSSNRKLGRAILNIGANEKVVLGVGQMQKRKGIEDFIDIAKLMPEVKFVWIGGRPFGAFTEGINRINQRILSAPSNVIFPGLMDLDIMPQIYASADAFAFPSYQENCPLAPIEAAASGLPVIFRNLPEYKKLYQNDYLNASDTIGFKTILEKLLGSKTEMETGKSISKSLISQFDKDQIYIKLTKIYYLLAQKKAKNRWSRENRLKNFKSALHFE